MALPMDGRAEMDAAAYSMDGELLAAQTGLGPAAPVESGDGGVVMPAVSAGTRTTIAAGGGHITAVSAS